jgi:hypothetical protein
MRRVVRGSRVLDALRPFGFCPLYASPRANNWPSDPTTRPRVRGEGCPQAEVHSEVAQARGSWFVERLVLRTAIQPFEVLMAVHRTMRLDGQPEWVLAPRYLWSAHRRPARKGLSTDA